jgi:heptosyltransferase III
MLITDPKKIIISRTDSIGDVCLTLPLAGILKEKFPSATLVFLGNTYTKPILECCESIDEIWEWSEILKLPQTEQISWLKKQNADVFIHVFPRKEIAQLASKAGIEHRIGTSHRLFHWLTCNHRPSFTRKNSDLHEAQLNTRLLAPLGISRNFSLAELYHYASFRVKAALPAQFETLLKPGKKNIILHPKSQGSALEWSLDHFMELAKTLDPSVYTIFFTGTAKEGDLFRSHLPQTDTIVDVSGKMTLPELIAFISRCDVLVAASTGPLHIAGLTGIKAVGLFSSRKPIHPGRWQPLGNKVVILEDKNFSKSTQPLSIHLRDVKRAVEEGL